MSPSRFDLGIRCRWLLTMAEGKAEPRQDAFVGIRGGKIARVSDWADGIEKKCEEFINADSHAVLPGLVNTHTHLAMTLFRGLEDDAPFHRWLFERILPLEEKLVDSEFVRTGTELAALECIRGGVTTVNEMYFFAETAAEVLDQAGLRGCVGQVWSGLPLPEDRVLGSNHTEKFKRLFKRYRDHSRIVPSLAPHAIYTCGEELFKEVAQLSKKHQVLIHTHLSETRKEVEDSLKSHGVSPVEYLHQLGALGPRTVAAHCVHFSEKDIEIFKQSGAAVAHNPDSNLKLGSGIAPISRYRREGIPVGFGTDGAAANNDLSIFGAMDLGTKLQKLLTGDNTAMVAADALVCATYEGAKVLGLQDRIGSLEEGKEADLIAVDLNYPNLTPLYDLRSQLVYSMQGNEVDTVICAGRVLMKEGWVLSMGQEATLAKAGRLGAKIQEVVNQSFS